VYLVYTEQIASLGLFTALVTNSLTASNSKKEKAAKVRFDANDIGIYNPRMNGHRNFKFSVAYTGSLYIAWSKCPYEMQRTIRSERTIQLPYKMASTT